MQRNFREFCYCQVGLLFLVVYDVCFQLSIFFVRLSSSFSLFNLCSLVSFCTFFSNDWNLICKYCFSFLNLLTSNWYLSLLGTGFVHLIYSAFLFLTTKLQHFSAKIWWMKLRLCSHLGQSVCSCLVGGKHEGNFSVVFGVSVSTAVMWVVIGWGMFVVECSYCNTREPSLGNSCTTWLHQQLSGCMV